MISKPLSNLEVARSVTLRPIADVAAEMGLDEKHVEFFGRTKAKGRPEGFEVTVREVRRSTGAGFLVAIAGNILTMPGLPRIPAALSIDVDEEGRVKGLF
jgi:formyltetrahydrofolate synthetase